MNQHVIIKEFIIFQNEKAVQFPNIVRLVGLVPLWPSKCSKSVASQIVVVIVNLYTITSGGE